MEGDFSCGTSVGICEAECRPECDVNQGMGGAGHQGAGGAGHPGEQAHGDRSKSAHDIYNDAAAEEEELRRKMEAQRLATSS